MIEVKNMPRDNYIHPGMPPTDGNHIFDLSDCNMKIYYYRLFENRSSKNTLYINKYNSLKELEEDIYGKCIHNDGRYYTANSFKEIYNNLNKEEFLDKINAMIEEYGNAIIADIDICVKTDEQPIRLMELYDKIMN